MRVASKSDCHPNKVLLMDGNTFSGLDANLREELGR